MQLILESKETRDTKTGEQYMELWFSYPDGSKKVRYWLWSFVHNDTNNLKQVWDTACNAKVGELYKLQFRKADFSTRVQFVVTVLDKSDAPISFID